MIHTRFCASAGLPALVQAHNRAVADGGELRLVLPARAPIVRRVFEVTGIDGLIPNFTDLNQALQRNLPRPPGGGNLSRGCVPRQPSRPPIPAPEPARPDGCPDRCAAAALAGTTRPGTPRGSAVRR